MSEVVMVEVVKIDEETGKSYSYNIPAPRIGVRNMLEGKPSGEGCDDWVVVETLPFPLEHIKGACNVGDFLIIEGKVYRRIRGGWREATDDDMAELLAAKLGEALEDGTWTPDEGTTSTYARTCSA